MITLLGTKVPAGPLARTRLPDPPGQRHGFARSEWRASAAVNPATLALKLIVSVNSAQQEVQQQGHATARTHDGRYRGLAAEVGQSSHAPAVRIEGIMAANLLCELA